MSISSKYLKVYNAKQFRKSVSGSAGANVYLTIGKSSPWANDSLPDSANTSVSGFNQIWQDMIGGKKIFTSDISHVVPKFPWVSNLSYPMYDDTTDSNVLKTTTSKFYVITDPELNVYKCLSNNYGAVSTVKPVSTTASAPDFMTTDGYVWKYMYTISSTDYDRFATTNYIPIKTIPADDNSTQWQVQNNAIEGAIHVIKVINPGFGYYTSTSSVVNYKVSAVGLNAYTNAGSTIESRGGLFINDSTTTAPIGANTYPQPSYNLWILDKSNGNVVFSKSYALSADYQTYGTNSDAGREAANLASKLNTTDGNTNFVILSTFGDPQVYRMTKGLPEAIYYCGGSRTLFGDNSTIVWANSQTSSANIDYRTDRWRHGAAYILVGTPGIGEANGIESLANWSDYPTSNSGSSLWNDPANASSQIYFNLIDRVLTVGRSVSDVTVNITGDGQDANAYAVLNVATNTVSSIVITNRGSGYTFANVSISSPSGYGATARAIISPQGGHGSDPLTELGGSYLTINPQLDNSEGGILCATNDYRQVALIEDPLRYGTSNITSNLAFSQLTVITLDPGDSGFLIDEHVYQGSSEQSIFSGVVTEWDSGNNKIKLSNVHGTPIINDPIIGVDSKGSRIVTSYSNPDCQPFTGKLLYINNISPLTRAPDQIDNFKIVMSF